MIVFVGDSNLDQYVTTAEKFSTLIGAALGHTVVTAGLSGDSAAGVLSRLPALLAQGPTHVVVMIGTNDMAGGLSTPMAALLPAYLGTMGQIIDLIRTVAVPVIISPPAIEQPQECLRYPRLIEGLRALCLQKRCAFFDLYGLMADDACTMQPATFLQWYRPEAADLYHLSPTGHQRVATAFLALMAPMAAQPPAPPPPPPDPEGMIPQAYGTPIGDMTAGGGLAAAFNGAKTTAGASCARKGATTVTSFIGKSFPAPQAISGFRFWGASDQGVSAGSTIELQLWVKSGAPSSDINGTYLGGTGTVADGPFFERLDCQPIVGDHVWVRVISTGELKEKYCAEVEFYGPIAE